MTERVGLLGYPVAHSVSPAMHNAAFAALGLDWQYDLMPVPPERFAEEVARRIRAGYRGFNVTIPHKQAAFALPQVTTITPAAQAIGAVNTLIVAQDGTLTADNTDWRGFLQATTGTLAIPIERTPCLVLGTGGSAQAVIYALQQAHAPSITQVSRHPDQPGVIDYRDLAHLAHDGYYIVNCTPVGMHPHGDQSPWPEGIPIPPQSTIYDLVYNPNPTQLVRDARAHGIHAAAGLEMLVLQGAFAFALWTGQQPPLHVMRHAAQAALSEH